MILGFRDFEFDLPGALLTSLIHVLDGMTGAELNIQNLVEIPEAQGVYQLLLRGEVAYIGKTDAEAGLKARLTRHAFTVQHRRNLSPSDVAFKAIRIYVFTAMDLETQLIRHYEPTWNNSGFGSNDPGRERDTTTLRPAGFDAQYPMDLDHVVAIPGLGKTPRASAVIRGLQAQLPYTLRVQGKAPRSRQIHSDFEEAIVSVPSEPYTTRQILTATLGAMPAGWQATLLPGRIIIYAESRAYPHGEIIAQS